MVGLVGLAAVIGLLAVAGQLRPGAPYDGRRLDPGQPLAMKRWTIALDGASLENRGSATRPIDTLVVTGTFLFDGQASSFGPGANGIVLARIGDVRRRCTRPSPGSTRSPARAGRGPSGGGRR